MIAANTLTANTTRVNFGNISISTTTLFINTTTVGTTYSLGKVFVGNSTSNSTINSTQLAIVNGTLVANYGAELVSIANSTVTSKVNATSFNITNTAGAFFTSNATNIRLGVAGSLANLTPTRLELGSGTTFIGSTGLSVGGGATMNTTHLDVDAIVTSAITANFTGNATRLDLFGLSRAGIVNATPSDANTVLRSDGQWVKPGLFWYASARENNSYNQPTVPIFWNNEEYSMIEISGWLRPHVTDTNFDMQFSHDGSTFTGFSADYHELQYITHHSGDAYLGVDNGDEADMTAVVVVSNGAQAGIYFFTEIQKRHGTYSTVRHRVGWRDSTFNDRMTVLRSWTTISNVNPIQGVQFLTTAGNVRDHYYNVKIYPT
jgi:hypothetical protein